MDSASRLSALALLAALVAGCGGGSPAPAPVPVPAPAPTVAQRTAAGASVAASAPDCVAVQPFYWSIGDATGRLADGSVGMSPPTAQTLMSIPSASKLVYGAYVAEQRAGVLTDTDVRFLNFASGYTAFTSCAPGHLLRERPLFGRSLGRDDPAAGDGAFSSPGAFGFNPRVDRSKAWWSVVARSANVSDEQEGVASMKCGRRIRAAWIGAQASS